MHVCSVNTAASGTIFTAPVVYGHISLNASKACSSENTKYAYLGYAGNPPSYPKNSDAAFSARRLTSLKALESMDRTTAKTPLTSVNGTLVRIMRRLRLLINALGVWARSTPDLHIKFECSIEKICFGKATVIYV